MINWPFYNESLVRRGQILLDFDVVDKWDHELSKMNKGKVGEPYCYRVLYSASRLHESIFPPAIQTDTRCSHSSC